MGDQLGAAVGLADLTGDGTVLTLNNSARGIVTTSGLYYGPVTLGLSGTGFGIGQCRRRSAGADAPEATAPASGRRRRRTCWFPH
ncbi:hypothetical protein OHA79_28570 [Streptomyces sp. NBC_00841]|uniref:hypothetical protein n=1 Tax=unclassified Streptomyces TaxID=2593676 RepID=UPI002252D24B|nr:MULTISPECIES: hypothetical protein [unclassified Streptomyces]MCX4533114.1 hypothetical protein [Streptomyces sp. NBC_01669]WSA01447.1 hypothetical protein OHA79_28570 [Streptomyces sp. NBC_00841]